MTAGSLTALHGDTIALSRQRADAAHAHVGDRVAVMLGDGTRTHATVVAIYTRALAFGDALLSARTRRRPPDQPAARNDPRPDRQPRPPSPSACEHWLCGIRDCGSPTAPR